MKEQNNPLDLNNLTMDDIDFSILPEIVAETEREEWEYKEKYGDDWWEHYVRETNPDFSIDSIEQNVNEAIYEGHYLCMNGSPELLIKIEHRYWEKMKQLFGPFYKRHINHPQNDPKINKALLKDALKSGKWRELPKKLQDEYHKLAREYPDTKDLDLNQLTEEILTCQGCRST